MALYADIRILLELECSLKAGILEIPGQQIGDKRINRADIVQGDGSLFW